MNDSIPTPILTTADTLHAVPRVVRPVPAVVRRQPEPVLSHADSAFFGLTNSPEDTYYLTARIENPLETALHPSSLLKTEADSIAQFSFVAEKPATKELQPAELGTTTIGSDLSWIAIVLIGIIALLGIVRFRTASFFSTLASAFTSDIYWRTLTNNLNIQFFGSSRTAFLISQVNTVLLLYECTAALGIESIHGLSHFGMFLVLIIAYAAYFVGIYILDRFIGFAFDINRMMNKVGQCKMLSFTAFGIVAIPLTILFPFIDERYYLPAIIIAAVVFVAIGIWRTFKSLGIISPNAVSLFYSILYLCAVEIMPVLCIIKTLQMG